MANRPATFRQGDLTKVLKAARAAGETFSRIEIDPATGQIIMSKADAPLTSDNLFDAWKAGRNARST